MTKKILKFLGKVLLFFLLIFVIQIVYYIIFYNNDNRQINGYDLVVVFPNEPERIRAGVLLAQNSKHKILAVAGVADKKLKQEMTKGLIPDDIAFINSGLSHTTVRDILCLKQLLKNYDKIIVVTSRYHVPRVKLLLKAMLFKDYNKVSVHAINTNDRTKTAFLNKMLNELKKMWGSIGELTIYSLTGSVDQEYTKVRKVSNFVRNILSIKRD